MGWLVAPSVPLRGMHLLCVLSPEFISILEWPSEESGVASVFAEEERWMDPSALRRIQTGRQLEGPLEVQLRVCSSQGS